MANIFNLLRQTRKQRGNSAEEKAGQLLKNLLAEGKIQEIILVDECSFMNSVLKTDLIVRRLDGILVPIQIKSSDSEIKLTEFVSIRHLPSDWSYPVTIFIGPQTGWEEIAAVALKKIESWAGSFRYEEWQLGYTPYLDFSTFKIFGRSIQLRIESFLEARAEPAKAEEHLKMERERRQKIKEERKKKLEKRKARKAVQKQYFKPVSRVSAKPPAGLAIEESWESDTAEEEKLIQFMEQLRQEDNIKWFFATHAYSWAAIAWGVDFVVSRAADGNLVPICARNSRKISEDRAAAAMSSFFNTRHGFAPLLWDSEQKELASKINSWCGNFFYDGWMIDYESYFDPKQYKNWSVQERLTGFLQLKWLKYGIPEEILNCTGLKTVRDKNGVIWLNS